ncbi:MAG: lysophospholipase [Cycloclasticus sp.]|nr:lysophospholipase [Cycloclasticus sp.]MBQ0789043.1 lysophospholipase [Cycloclasticus sp.]
MQTAVIERITEWTTFDGTRMHGIHWSAAVKSPYVICLVHGLGEHSGRYSALANYFVSRGIDVHAFDLRGHGLSQGRRGHSEYFNDLIKDVDHFLRHESGINMQQPYGVYGHSLGGMITLSYALNYPAVNRAVVLSSAFLKPAFEPPKWKLILAGYLQALWPTVLLSNEVPVEALSKDPRVLKEYIADPLVHNSLSAGLGLQLLKQGRYLLDTMRVIDFPLLVMHGDADKVTCHQASELLAAKAGKRCELVIWPGLFHELQHETEKEAVFDCSIDWLKEVLRPL